MELDKFDTNNDGFFTKNERNLEQEEAMKLVTNDTARIFAKYTLIPFSIILSLLLLVFWNLLLTLWKRFNGSNSTPLLN